MSYRELTEKEKLEEEVKHLDIISACVKEGIDIISIADVGGLKRHYVVARFNGPDLFDIRLRRAVARFGKKYHFDTMIMFCKFISVECLRNVKLKAAE